MKWFKHYTNAHKGEALQVLSAEFGKQTAYAWYFLLVEYFSDKWDGSAEPRFTVTMASLCGHLTATPSRLRRYLAAMQRCGSLEFTENGKLIDLTFPKLLEIRHRDAIPSGQRPAKNQPISGQEEEENRRDKKKSAFLDLWASLPIATKSYWQKTYGDEFIQDHGPEAYAYYAADPKAPGWNKQAWASRIQGSFKRTQEHLAKKNASTLKVVTDADVICGIAPDV